MKKLVTLLALGFSIIGCKKNDTQDIEPKINAFAIGKIKSTIGGSLENGTGIKITFPANGLPYDVDVKIGIRGDEPTTVENSKLQIVGKPFTLELPIDTLIKTALIEFPKPTDFTSTDEIAYFAFNGKTYMPLYYQVIGSKVEVKLDVVNYVKKSTSTLARGLNPLGELVIIGIVYNQTPPSNQMGLKEVTVAADGKLIYTDVNTISSNEKYIIFIHGWFSGPHAWEKFIPFFKAKQNVGYTKILTFGYNSSLAINDNGLNLANVLSTKFKNKKVDLVGHSMGGLVSRAAIENHNSSQYVRNLVTLGTPHKGSPLAALRNFIGILVALDGTSEYNAFNMNTQGFNDLFPKSNFITNLNSNAQSTIPYYAIAAENNPCDPYLSFLGIPNSFGYCFPTSQTVLLGNDDGVVAKSSALGVLQNNNIGYPTELYLNTFMAHTEMVRNESFATVVAGYLNQHSQEIPTADLVAYYPFNGNANDVSGNNNNGTTSGGIIYANDRFNVPNKACSFNGSDAYIVVPPSLTINSITKTTDATFTCWFKTDSWNNTGGYISKNNNSNDLHYRFLVNETSTLLQVEQPYEYARYPALQVNQWYHFAAVKSGNIAKFYIDGNLISSTPMIDAAWASDFNTNLEIGRDAHGPIEYTRGVFDEIRIYKRALTSAEINAIKNN